MKFRKKPVVIDAIQYRPHENCAEVAAFLGVPFDPTECQDAIEGAGWDIDTLEGVMTARPGDWIIRGVKGEFYPCKPDIFEATYERVEEDGPMVGHNLATTFFVLTLALFAWGCDGNNAEVVSPEACVNACVESKLALLNEVDHEQPSAEVIDRMIALCREAAKAEPCYFKRSTEVVKPPGWRP